MSRVNFNQHRNWLLTIAQINLPFIFWGTCILVLLLIVPTFFFRPVYYAQGILALDSDLSKVLRGVDTPYPTTMSTDYIRYEYFSTHALALMRVPQLAASVVSRWDVRDLWGNKLPPEYFIEPGRVRLLLSNNGQGIKAEWIADTQQFSVTGYSKDPDMAAAYARDYINAFLNQNSAQFRDTLGGMLARLDDLRNATYSRINQINQQVKNIKIEHKTGDPSSEIGTLATKISTIRTSVDDLLLAERVYESKKAHLTRELANLEKLRVIERVMQENPQINSLKTEIETLSGTLAEASVEYTAEHPDYKRTERKLKNAKETLKKEVAKTFAQESAKAPSALDTAIESMLNLTVSHIAYQKAIEHYSDILNSYQARMDELVIVDAEVSTLTKEKDGLFDVLSTADKNRFIVNGLQNGTIPFFRLVSPVNMNKDNLKYYKYFPKRKIILLLAAVISLAILSFLVLGKEMHANSLYRGWQLSTLSKRINYADLPDLGDLKCNHKGVEAVICNYIRNLCLAVRDSKILRITSGDANEGKATVSRAIAWYYHQLGNSVVVVDGDVTHQSLTRAYGLDNQSAEDHSGGQKEIKEAVFRDQASGISLVPAKQCDFRDPGSTCMPTIHDLFSALGADYERIIFVDSPLNDDHLMLSDGIPAHDVILVLRSGAHAIYEVEQVHEMNRLSNGQATLKGVVVNRIPFEANVLTLKGLSQLCIYLIRKPLYLLRRRA